MTSSGLNVTFNCIDDASLSIINNFWEHPDKFRDEIQIPSPPSSHGFSPNTPPESPDIKYEIVYTGNCHNPFALQSLSPSPSFDSAGDYSFLSSESCLTAADSIDIPLEWLEGIEEELPTLDENALFEALELIEREAVTSTTPAVPYFPCNNNNFVPSNVGMPRQNPSEPSFTKVFFCIACEKHFKNASGLKKHFKTKTHRKIVEERVIEDPVNRPETWKVYKFFCFVCGEGFITENDVVDHIKGH